MASRWKKLQLWKEKIKKNIFRDKEVLGLLKKEK